LIERRGALAHRYAIRIIAAISAIQRYELLPRCKTIARPLSG
jgi:hypothetical protein